MGKRRLRLDLRLQQQAESRTANGPRKEKERDRRNVRMLGILGSVQPPYTPSLLSWLSGQLDKPSRLITPDDVKNVLEKKLEKKKA